MEPRLNDQSITVLKNFEKRKDFLTFIYLPSYNFTTTENPVKGQTGRREVRKVDRFPSLMHVQKKLMSIP